MAQVIFFRLPSTEPGYVLTDEDQTYPITNLIDGDGDETDDVDQAVTFVAGAGDTWFTVSMSDFKPDGGGDA